MKIISNKKYAYQPELAMSIIYWSLTFCILFLGIIYQLEAVALSMPAIVIAIIFLVVGLIQLKARKLTLDQTKSELTLHGVLPRAKTVINFHDIQLIELGKHQVKINLNFSNKTIWMKKKDISQLETDLKSLNIPVKRLATKKNTEQ